jgi:hypothetical protein
MKTIRPLLALALFAAASALVFAAAAGGAAHVRAIMVVASNEKGKTDPRLAPYETNLKRILRFESYRMVAEGSTAVAPGGEAAVALARDHRVVLVNEGGAVRATWFEGGRKISALALPPGRPSVLGGPKWNDKGEICVVILVPE